MFIAEVTMQYGLKKPGTRNACLDDVDWAFEKDTYTEKKTSKRPADDNKAKTGKKVEKISQLINKMNTRGRRHVTLMNNKGTIWNIKSTSICPLKVYCKDRLDPKTGKCSYELLGPHFNIVGLSCMKQTVHDMYGPDIPQIKAQQSMVRIREGNREGAILTGVSQRDRL